MVDPNPARAMPAQLRRYWVAGKGGAKIRWGAPGDFNRCVRQLRKYFPKNPKGLCNVLHQDALGAPPGKGHPGGAALVASGTSGHGGAMAALRPSRECAARMAVQDGLAPGDLHMTLAYFGECADLSEDQRHALVDAFASAMAGVGPVSATAFGVAAFNPGDEDACVAYQLSGADLEMVAARARRALGECGVTLPPQHTPWIPHVTARYEDTATVAPGDYASGLGDVVFDTLWLAFGDTGVDIALGGPLMEVDGDDEDASTLLAAQPYLGDCWAGAIAPVGQPTDDGRVFAPGALSHRPLPLPLSYRRASGRGHDGSVVVGRVLGITYGPDAHGQEYAWAWGDWMDPGVIPEVTEARALVRGGVMGPSVDPGGKIVAREDDATGLIYASTYGIGGVTLVSIPAFSQVYVHDLPGGQEWEDDEDMALDTVVSEEECGCGQDRGDGEDGFGAQFAVNVESWRALPVADRKEPFDNDDAVKRIFAWASNGSDTKRMRAAFLWRDPSLPEDQYQSYRMPLGDIIDGELRLVYHAIYAAAALISGAHGGLPSVPDKEKDQLRAGITKIYEKLADEYQDPQIRAPWDRPMDNNAEAALMAEFADTTPYGEVPYADPGYQPDGVKRYPIDTPDHIRAAWGYINKEANASRYTAKQLRMVRERIVGAAKKAGITLAEGVEPGSKPVAVTASTRFPVAPPRAWFDAPPVDRVTPIVVTDEGRVYGHLAAWGVCHRDVSMRECVLAPHSAMGYAPYHLGYVTTAEGDTIQVGKIVMDTRHAGLRMGPAATAVHYDDTGDEVAVVRAYEDAYGVMLAGAVVAEADMARVAKLRRSPLSGDWRRVGANLELIAALAVNVPAYPVYAFGAGQQLSLVAAGCVSPGDGGDVDDLADRVAARMRERERREAMAAELDALTVADRELLSRQFLALEM